MTAFSASAGRKVKLVPALAWRTSRRIAGRLVTIRGKLLMAFLCMTVITAALGAYAAVNIAEGARLVIETFDNSLMSISFARAAAVDFAAMEGLAARRRLITDPAAQRDLSSRIDDLADTLRDDLSVAAERSRSVRATAAAQAVGQAAAEWQAAEQALRAEDQADGGDGSGGRWTRRRPRSPNRSICW